ncbi:heme peroxidase [Absidia repens]|uniref:Heme peroxidase n=1 Tax=Absidia repens TaxID=90262 RepID=A0A1X2I835_9FUNG|nr:heme peroxidase [Absidia repens]
MTIQAPMTNTHNDKEHKKLHDYITTIERDLGREGLVNTLKELVIANADSSSSSTTTSDPTTTTTATAAKKKGGLQLRKSFGNYSSQPTGLSWKAQALVKDLEHLFGITPQRTGAIKEVLTLPFSQQRILMGALVERLLVSGGAPMNDRSGTLEATVNILEVLGPNGKDLVNETLQPLMKYYHNTIPKPYITYVGNSFRTADGSFNSLVYPTVGTAGNNYVRNVNSFAKVNEQLPPPHLVFERLLKRPHGHFTPHKSGINMLLFYLAIFVTHDLFYTDRKNPKRNLTSSYLDMSPLYGFNRTDQESVRQMKNGLLKPDQWFDKRLVLQPPGVGALLVLFNRNHNYAAKHLLDINENGRFNYGPGEMLATVEEQDEELFQTARLINNACFRNIIIHEYLRSIFGSDQDSDFVFDPLQQPLAPPIYGNEVSIEFNVIYRWHAALGKQDEEWLDSVMTVLGNELKQYQKQQQSQGTAAPGPAPGPTTTTTTTTTGGGTDQSGFEAFIQPFNDHFVKASQEELAMGLPLAGMHRDLSTGKFDDAALGKAIRDGYTQVASEIGHGQNIPASFEHIEMAGIMQARQLKCCYFNEFREYLDLMPLKTFKDFSEKVEVQQALKDLYGTPDKVELYAGVMVERTLMIGLRLPYTMTRGVLSDAINLLRNDRFLNQELTPNNLTNWGYEFSQGDPEQYNRVLPKMIRLHFETPNGQPLFTPDEVKNLFVAPGYHGNSANQ